MKKIILKYKEKSQNNQPQKIGFYGSFIIPIIIMLIYFIAIGAFPFGNNTIMTVDLGQQYIDFFGLFKDTILHHPSNIFYSFTKDLGGDMIGVWSYYLLSPLNFIFLFFSKQHLDVAVILITLLKYGFAGLSFYTFSCKTVQIPISYRVATSISYALSGFFVANQFNIMWLDAAYLLPMVALGIFKIFTEDKTETYVFSLSAILIINYYMGYMICIFAVLYFIYLSALNYHDFKTISKKSVKFFLSSITASLISAFIILPTLFQLTQSKGTYTIKKIHWKFEYSPIKIITKFNIGAYNFDAVSSGLPNLFIPSLLLAFALLFFLIRKIPFRVRCVSLLVTVFLTLSMCFEPLNLFWHGFQFPVWYPYRFSYVAIFWLLTLSIQGIENLKIIEIKKIIIPSLFFIFIFYTSLYFRKSLTFLNYKNIIITCFFFVLSIAMLGGLINKYPLFFKLSPFIVIIESITNAYVSLSMIGFISHSEFSQYVQNTNKIVQKIKKNDCNFYRFGKDFERTNNDAMMLDFNGTDQFNSMLEPKISNLYANLGQPQSEGDVIYGNGNIFVDQLLGIKYFLTTNDSNSRDVNEDIYKPIGTRNDIMNYGIKFQSKEVIVHENPYALKNGFLVSEKVLKPKLTLINPISNYNTIYQHLTNQEDFSDLFLPFFNYTEKLINLKKDTSTNAKTYQKINSKKSAKIIISLYPKTNDPHYVSLNGDLTDNHVSYSVNGHPIRQNQTIQNTIIQSLFQNQKDKKIEYVINVKNKQINLYDFNFYFMDQTKFLIQNSKLKNHQLKLTTKTSNQLKGQIEVDRSKQVIFFSIPYAKGWHAKIDGKPQKIKKAFDNFIALPLKKGKHTIEIKYIPPYFYAGLTISSVSLSAYFLIIFFKGKKTK